MHLDAAAPPRPCPQGRLAAERSARKARTKQLQDAIAREIEACDMAIDADQAKVSQPWGNPWRTAAPLPPARQRSAAQRSGAAPAHTPLLNLDPRVQMLAMKQTYMSAVARAYPEWRQQLAGLEPGGSARWVGQHPHETGPHHRTHNARADHQQKPGHRTSAHLYPNHRLAQHAPTRLSSLWVLLPCRQQPADRPATALLSPTAHLAKPPLPSSFAPRMLRWVPPSITR
jgi:hypothetical protein